MNLPLKLLGALFALSAGAAHAGTIQIGGVAAGADGMTSSQTGVCSVNFNGGNASNTCGASYTQGANLPLAASHFRTGSQSGQYASPAGDTTGFLTVGPTDGTPIKISLATSANYFGFYAGSLDAFNMVQFFLDGAMVDQFTGTEINAVAFPGTATNGNQAAAQYIDYFTNTLFNSIVYSSSSNAFETDNHAFGIASPRVVPEPSSIALLGLGAIGFVARRRKAKAD